MTDMPSLHYICVHCGEIVPFPWKSMDTLDSGTTLACPECGRHTVVDLSMPEGRATRYRAAEAAQALGAPITLHIGVRTPVEADHISRAMSVMAGLSRLLSLNVGPNEVLAMAATQLQIQARELMARDGQPDVEQAMRPLLLGEDDTRAH